MALLRRLLPWLFAAAIAANLFELASFTVLHWNGDTGIATAPTGEPFQSRATAVYGPAFAAGFRVGDRFDAREMFRANQFQSAVPGKPYRLIAHRGDQTIARTVTSKSSPVDWWQIFRLAGVFWVLGFAWLIASRAQPTRENMLLLLFLLMLALQSPFWRIAWPDTRLAFLSWSIVFIPFDAVCILLAIYAAGFGRPLSPIRRILLWCTYGWVVFGTAWQILVNSTYLVPWTDLKQGSSAIVTMWCISLIDILSWLCVALAIPAAERPERRRIAWVLLSYAPFVAGVAVGNVFGQSQWNVSSPVTNASFFFIPAGLTYAALARRMFDVGFVVNRGAVFGIVSAIVVGAFVLLEWALGKWFENVSHETSLALNVALALVLGISIRFINDKVDAGVDNLFFRKRHENEMALRRFGREAAFFTDAAALLERTIATILAHTEASTARMLMTDDLNPNDPAVVAMRAWHDPLDLTRYQTALRGDYAFPMLAHGELAGVIVCGPKRTGEHYAPDEIDALQSLAHGVGLALDGLHRPRQPSELAEMATLLKTLLARLDIMAGAPDEGHADA